MATAPVRAILEGAIAAILMISGAIGPASIPGTKRDRLPEKAGITESTNQRNSHNRWYSVPFNGLNLSFISTTAPGRAFLSNIKNIQIQ